jgi:hypothetical protein
LAVAAARPTSVPNNTTDLMTLLLQRQVPAENLSKIDAGASPAPGESK